MLNIQKLSVGPIVGHVDVNHARIWGRATHEKLGNGNPRRAFGITRIKKEGGSYRSAQFFKMNPNFDMSGIAIFQNLEPNTDYIYQIGWIFSDKELDELRSSEKWDWKDAYQGRLKTATHDIEAPRSFIFGSCRYLLRLFGGSWFDNRGDKTFRSIIRQIEEGDTIDKFLMIGDQIYADDLSFLYPDQQIDQYFSRYRDVFSQEHIRRLMSNVSTYMTLDDHEIEDNWPDNANTKDMVMKYPNAMHAYQTYQMSHSPLIPINTQGKLLGTPDKYYYTFQDGCCDFFVTDTRTERDPDEDEIMSDIQMNQLLDWLSDGSQRVKLVVTSVPFFPDAKKQKEHQDKWSGYRRQRDQVIQHIRTHAIHKVVFLAGDVHCSMAAELNIAQHDETPLHIYSIISSSFYWPYPHMKRRDFQLTGTVSSVDDEHTYKLGQVSDLFSGDNFTRVKMTQEGFKVEVYERKGDSMHTAEFLF